MSWKLRPRSGKADTSTLVVLFVFFPSIIGLLIAPVPTLIIIFFLLFLGIFNKNLDKQNQPTLFNKQERIERERKNKDRYEDFKNYKGSESYQALLKKYDGNIPGSGLGDRSKGNTKGRNLGSRRGQKGGRYNERISKKGNRYRQYF